MAVLSASIAFNFFYGLVIIMIMNVDEWYEYVLGCASDKEVVSSIQYIAYWVEEYNGDLEEELDIATMIYEKMVTSIEQWFI